MSFKQFQQLIDSLSLRMDSYEKLENSEKIAFVKAYNTIITIPDSLLVSKSSRDFQSQFDLLLKKLIWEHEESMLSPPCICIFEP